MKVQLVVVQGKPEGMVIPLASSRYKIGRGEGCQLRPNSDLVSREHAEFTQEADTVQVSDLGSRNGTEVNGKRLPANQPVTLKSGDLIKVGTLTFAISIEGVLTGKAAGLTSSPGRKISLDDVSNDEIDAWLVSDPSRPTPDRPSGVYGGDTITLETYKNQEVVRAKSVPTPRPAAPRPTPTPDVAAAPPPPPPDVAPIAPQAPTPVAAQAVAPPEPVAVADPVAPPAYFPSPEPIAAPAAPAPVAVAIAPAPTPPPAPVAVAPVAVAPPQATVEMPTYNPIFNFLADSPDLPEIQEDTRGDNESGSTSSAKDDGIPDFSSLRGDDDDEISDSTQSGSAEEEFVDESNPFYVKKPEAAPTAAAAKAKPKDSSAAADEVLRKIMDRRRAK